MGIIGFLFELNSFLATIVVFVAIIFYVKGIIRNLDSGENFFVKIFKLIIFTILFIFEFILVVIFLIILFCFFGLLWQSYT